MFEPVNIVEKLKAKQDEFVLAEANKILNEQADRDISIQSVITSSKGCIQNLDIPEEALILDLKVIQNICEYYRLRFLPGKYFKGEIPYEALIKIKDIERSTGSRINEFMIIAPADLFNLKDEYEDPVLVTPIGGDKFLFIHQWGNDMSWYRKLIYFPIRNFETYIATLFTVSLLFSILVPWNWIVRERNLYDESFMYYRIMLFGSSVAWFFIISFYYGFVSRKNFSRGDWDNVYFNK